jgi:hypothetical protein
MHAGGVVSEEAAPFDDILTNANTWLTLMEYLLDPIKTADYIEQNCQDRFLEGETSAFARLHATFFLQVWHDQYTWIAGQSALLCVDNFSRWDLQMSCAPFPPPMAGLQSMPGGQQLLPHIHAFGLLRTMHFLINCASLK